MERDNSPFKEIDYDNGNSANGIEETSEPLSKYNNTIRDNPIQILLKAYEKTNENGSIDMTFSFELNYQCSKWLVNMTLDQIKAFIHSLQSQSYVYLPYESLNSLQLGMNAAKLTSDISCLMKYLSYRYDVLLSPLADKSFGFNQCNELLQMKQYLSNNSLHLLYKFSIESIEQSASDLIYDTTSGLLLLAYEDISLLSSIGRFWSLIDAEALGSLRVYQRVFDDNQKPFFTKALSKSFDVRLSKIDISHSLNKIFVGFENGTVHSFNLNYLQASSELNGLILNKKIVITEGVKFKYLQSRITGFGFMSNYVFIASKENKIITAQFAGEYASEMPEIVFNASIKKRMEGRGDIESLRVDSSSLKLYVISSTNFIMIYDIIKDSTSVKISFWREMTCADGIKDIYFKEELLFVALKNKIEFFKMDSDAGNKESVLNFDKNGEDKVSVSSRYFMIEYNNQIEAICYFGLENLLIIGLTNGTLVMINSKSLEVIYAKSISQDPIIRLILLEEYYVLIVGDKKGTTFFFRFGSE